MRKILFQLPIIIIVLFSAMNALCQKSTNIDAINVKSFSSQFLINGKTGKIFNISSNDSLSNVVVRWSNGWFAIGQTSIEGKIFGKWYIFDKKNRYRNYFIFGFDGECVLYSKKMNKKGKTVSEFKAITPCF